MLESNLAFTQEKLGTTQFKYREVESNSAFI